MPAHWLGRIGVPDQDATLRRLLDLGSERLGPPVETRDGTTYATLRDPFGAVVAVGGCPPSQSSSPVVWHQLHTRDLDRAWAAYSDVFGWFHTGTFDVPDPEGGHRMFAWKESGPSVGSMANTARWPGVHPHWMYYFPTADLDAALAKVRAGGGVVISDPAKLPNGDRLAPCDDPQGAAFGLYQSAAKQ